MSTVSSSSTQLSKPITSQDPTYLFQTVKGSNEHMDYVAQVFKQQIVPLYGDQIRALEKIRESRDRRCQLLYEGQIPVGILVYKKTPNKKRQRVEFDSRAISQPQSATSSQKLTRPIMTHKFPSKS